MMSFGEALKAQRKAQKLTRVKLASLTGLSSRGLWRIETGQCRPYTSTMKKILQHVYININEVKI